jgi:hypothetical protein
MKRGFVSTVLAALLASRAAIAADGSDVNRDARELPRDGDYLLPAPGTLTLSVGSGVPFLGVAELAYGVGRGFAVGGVLAATPDIGGVQGTTALGLRPRGVLFRAGPWRATLVTSALFYPSVPGFGGDRDPWVLIRPEITIERRLESGAQVNFGLGVIAAACMESLLTLGKEHDATVMGGVWNTVRVGGAIPVGGATRLFGEASLVMTGLVPARQWIGVVPVVAVVGVAVGL